EEPIKGVKVRILEAQVAKDPALRGPAQITPAIRKGILGAILTSKPVLLEPIYKIEISTPLELVGECVNIVRKRRGKISSSEYKGFITVVSGFIPVAETFGLTQEMRSATSGRAFWQCSFSHWERVPENVTSELIKQIRKRKGLPLEVPTLKAFMEVTS
ncbi:MAG: elongation factor EF-2, partial [Candidatus Bathyarchaeia archaeon]